MNRTYSFSNKDNGFTIAELLIAITIFSIIMLTASAGLIQVGRMYYKTVIVSRTQNANRAVIDEVSRALQFSGSRPDIRRSTEGNVVRFCIGSTRFTIALDDGVVGRDVDAYAILKDPGEPGCPEMSPLPSSDSFELLGDNMRLTDFDVRRVGTTDNYMISSRILYGDDSVVEEIDGQKVCRVGNPGVEFCAVSELDTTITRRLTGE